MNLSSIGTLGNRPNISFYSFKELKSLKELHLASNEINSIYGVADLTGLDVLDLKDNNISDIEYLVNKNGDEIDVENSLRAGKIDLNGNKIVDISVYWLDLSNNSIYDIEPLSKYGFSSSNNNGKELFLENENITFGLYDKSIDVDHYIICQQYLDIVWIQVNLHIFQVQSLNILMELEKIQIILSQRNIM